MNLLFISNDPNICEEGSALRLRMRAYAEEVAKTGGVLHIITRTKHGTTITDGPLIIHGRRGKNLLAMRSLARKLIKKEHVAVVSAQDPFEHGWVAVSAARGTQAKLHIQLHTDAFSPWFVRSGISRSPKVRMPFLNRIRQRTADRVLPKADGVRVVS